MTTEVARVERTRWVGIITLALTAILVMLTLAGLFALRVLAAQQADLRTSSRRGECRTAITNADEDRFRHRIGAALAGVRDRQDAKVDAILEAIQDEELTQHKIERICPAPLARAPRTPTTTTEGKP